VVMQTLRRSLHRTFYLFRADQSFGKWVIGLLCTIVVRTRSGGPWPTLWSTRVNSPGTSSWLTTFSVVPRSLCRLKTVHVKLRGVSSALPRG
jgi:hypothetical protein